MGRNVTSFVYYAVIWINLFLCSYGFVYADEIQNSDQPLQTNILESSLAVDKNQYKNEYLCSHHNNTTVLPTSVSPLQLTPFNFEEYVEELSLLNEPALKISTEY
ncbi:hypothetical protein PVAND_005260 [Polypedilum vanderplanki]|uniref:Uncharacterized protein n=1 Tax=Polypedilum vanderplanki TaxID=319348 RepID=A0A9J6BZV8_POLVA|nr:hypothetical protein PVAND_005260 [Polypedilum vanderplanki]